jgi:hypothetical protein
MLSGIVTIASTTNSVCQRNAGAARQSAVHPEPGTAETNPAANARAIAIGNLGMASAGITSWMRSEVKQR